MASNTTTAKVRTHCGIDDTTVVTDAQIDQFRTWANQIVTQDASGAGTTELEILETVYSSHFVWLHINSAATDNFSSESFSLSKNFKTVFLDEYNRLLPKLKNDSSSSDITPLGERKRVPDSFSDQR
jgi:hypothetical protein